MTVSSNYSNYAPYNSSTSSVQRQKPNFEEMANEIMSGMDSDGSGSINLDEFTSALGSSQSSSSTSLSDIFSSIDTNSDGAMSSEEFMAALEASKPQHKPDEMGSMPPPPPPPPSNEDSASTQDSSSTNKTYSALDTNKDGTISLEELLSTLNDKLDEESQSTTSEDKSFEKLKSGMLERMVSYYSSSSSNTTSSTLSLSA